MAAGGTRTYGLGFEAGLLIGDRMRVGAGYNIFGFIDDDLAADEYTDQGFYIDFGLTFDERLFGLGMQRSGGSR